MKTVFRFLITSTAGVTAFATVALADMHDGSMHSVDGHVRTRLEITDNNAGQDLDYTEQWLNRARLNLNVMPTDTLQVRITPEFTHTWDTGPDGVGNNTDDSLNDENFTAHEAWMSWMPHDMVNLYVGRQVLSYGNELVFGTNDWMQRGRSWDAARVQVSYDLGTTDLFLAKVNERNVNGGVADGNLLGLYNAFDLTDHTAYANDLDVYFFMWDDAQTGANRTRLAILGTRVDGMVQMVDYGVEVTGQFGTDNNVSGTDTVKGIQGDLDLGVNFMDRHRVGMGVAYANSEYQDLFSHQHKFFGLADQVTRQNLLALSGSADLGLTDEFNVMVAGYYFMAAKDDLGTAGGRTAALNKRALAFEGDLVATFKPEEMIEFQGGYAFFKPLSGYKNATTPASDKVMSDFYLQGTLKF